MPAVTISIPQRTRLSLAQLSTELGQYAELARLSLEEAIEKKGRDLGIKLYQGFKEVQWGGPGKTAGLARAELATRTAAGRGTRVREVLRRRYREARSELDFDVRSYGQQRRRAGTLDQWSSARDKGIEARAKRRSLWQKIVGEEIRMRQSGIGYLAASFLLFRRATRFSTSKGKMVASLSRDFVPNRTGKPLGAVERAPGRLSILGYAEGLDVVDSRHAVVPRAIEAVRADMIPYIQRKLREQTTRFRYARPAA